MNYEEEKAREFGHMCYVVEQYLKNYGHPHMTIIATQRGLEILEGIEAHEFKLED